MFPRYEVCLHDNDGVVILDRFTGGVVWRQPDFKRDWADEARYRCDFLNDSEEEET